MLEYAFMGRSLVEVGVEACGFLIERPQLKTISTFF